MCLLFTKELVVGSRTSPKHGKWDWNHPHKTNKKHQLYKIQAAIWQWAQKIIQLTMSIDYVKNIQLLVISRFQCSQAIYVSLRRPFWPMGWDYPKKPKGHENTYCLRTN